MAEFFDEASDIEISDYTELAEQFCYDEQIYNNAQSELEDVVANSNIAYDYFQEVARYELLTDREIEELFHRYKETGDISIRNRIANANLRLVISIARHYNTLCTQCELLDLIQDGNEGLLLAIDKFDVSMGNKFSTYAYYWIYQKINRSGQTEVHVPVYLRNLKVKYARFVDHFKKKNGYTPSPEEIMEGAQITPKQYELIKMSKIDSISLNDYLLEEEKTTYQEIIKDPDAKDPEEEAINKSYNEIWEDLLLNSGLTDREIEAMKKLNQFQGFSRKTLDEVADEMGCSRQNVFIMENSAKRKMKKRYLRMLEAEKKSLK